MEDTTNWWLLIFIGWIAFEQLSSVLTSKDAIERLAKVIVTSLYWFLVYMAGVFTLL